MGVPPIKGGDDVSTTERTTLSPTEALTTFQKLVETMSLEEIYAAASYVRNTPNLDPDACADVLFLLKNRKVEKLLRSSDDVDSKRTEEIKGAINAMSESYNADTITGVAAPIDGAPDPEKKIEADLRDHRVWYRFWKDWTPTEIFARLFVGATYVLLCGISIHYSLKHLLSKEIDIEIPGEEGSETITETEYLIDKSLVLLLASFGALITAMVNMKGFWTNICALIRDFFGKSRKDDPQGLNKVAYYLYTWCFSLTLAILTTMLTLSGVRETLGGVENNSLWYFTATLFFMTFIAIWALFSQEQRKWLAGTPQDFFNRTTDFLKRMFGLTPDPTLGATQKKDIHPGAVLLRGVLATSFLVLMTYFAYAMREQMSEATTLGLSDVFRVFEWSNSLPNENIFAGANSTIATIFLIAVTLYNAGMVKRLADVTTLGLMHAYERLAEPAKNYPKVVQALCATLSCLTIVYPLYLLGAFIWRKEKECLAEARQYAYQETIKGSALPSWLTTTLRMLFLNLPFAVIWNGANNGALYAESKLSAMEDNRVEHGKDPGYSDKQVIKGAAAGLSAGSRSCGFGLITTLENQTHPEAPSTEEQRSSVVLFSGQIERSRVYQQARCRLAPAT